MSADLTKNQEAIFEHLVGVRAAAPYNTFQVKDFLKYNGATANPADFTAVANASAVTTATITCTGVAVGDIVIGVSPVSGLAANSVIVNAYVSATDTVTVLVANLLNTTVTTTAITVNILVADVT